MELGTEASAPPSIQEELTGLDYARYHGLCRDYLSERPTFDPSHIPSDAIVQAALQDPPGSQMPIAHPWTFPKEPLVIPREAAHLVKASISDDNYDSTLLIGDHRGRAACLKQEVPFLLQADSELDLLNFGSPIVPDFTDIRIPFETTNVELDEGLDWPADCCACPAQCERKAQGEKLAVSKGDLVTLQKAITNSFSAVEYEIAKADSSLYIRNSALDPVTPPLLPLSPPATPYIPSSPGNHLELLSETEPSVELQQVQDQLVLDDALVPPSDCAAANENGCVLSEGSFLPSAINPLQGSSPAALLYSGKRKADDLKVEGPLTPPMSSQSPEKRMRLMSFSDMVHEHVPELLPATPTGDASQDSPTAFFKEVAHFAEECHKQLEHEKLSEVDTTKRVDAPELDFSLPVAPWDEFGHKLGHAADETELDAQARFLLHVKRNHLKTFSSWHGVARLERTLHWSPFPPQLAHVSVDESLEDDESFLARLLHDMAIEDVLDSSCLAREPGGLRSLREDEDESDDELQSADCGVQADLQVLLKKKKLEFEDKSQDRAVRGGTMKIGAKARRLSSTTPATDADTPKRPRERVKAMQKTVTPKRQPDNSVMFGGSFSAGNALHNFMKLHGKDVEEPEAELRPQLRGNARNKPASDEAVQAAPTQPPDNRDQTPAQRSTSPKLPFDPSSLQSSSYILSTTLLRERRLMRRIEALYPSACFIERDFSAPHSPAQEADLLLSPSTGLVVTTLQQIKQRALPGQPDHSPVRDTIVRLQARYERLVVLVGDGALVGAGRQAERYEDGAPVAAYVLDTHDRAALKKLEDFAARLDADVEVVYAGGGDEALAIAVVTKMAHWGIPQWAENQKHADGSVNLMQEETLWELFLRRAGLNAFAAQGVLSSLRSPQRVSLGHDRSLFPLLQHHHLNVPTSLEPDASSGAVVEVGGLPAFVLMPATERVRQFQALLGGKRVLNRVSRLLDQRWPSAVHEFAM